METLTVMVTGRFVMKKAMAVAKGQTSSWSQEFDVKMASKWRQNVSKNGEIYLVVAVEGLVLDAEDHAVVAARQVPRPVVLPMRSTTLRHGRETAEGRSGGGVSR